MADSLIESMQQAIDNLQVVVSNLNTRVTALEKLLQDYPPRICLRVRNTQNYTI